MENFKEGKRYNNLSGELKNIFGEKIIKLSVDLGFTCLNKNGKVGRAGCIFCGEKGSGEFTEGGLSIKEQIEGQKNLLRKKWGDGKYIVYFQNFTNTYKDVDSLRAIYYEALDNEGVIGLAIATRPDELGEEVLKLLDEINRRSFLWIEMGLQTIKEETALLIKRGYPLETYNMAMENLNKLNIKTVSHVIVGLPGESKEDALKTIGYIGKSGNWGIKIHSLYIQRGTDLFDYYNKNPFKILSMEEYVDVVTEGLSILPPGLVVHRITGDCKRDLLFEPKWTLNKLKIISTIDRKMKEKNIFQGSKYLTKK